MAFTLGLWTHLIDKHISSSIVSSIYEFRGVPTVNELDARLKVSPKIITNKMSSDVFTKGMHYFSSKGLRPDFEWSAVQKLFLTAER